MGINIYIVDDEQMAIQYFHYLLKNTEMDCEIRRSYKQYDGIEGDNPPQAGYSFC